MYLILCHTTADFDALGAAVGLSRLIPGSRIVLTGGCHPTVKDFLALHRDEYPLIERRSVNPKQIRGIAVVDTQSRDRVGKAAQWFDLPHVTDITVYDHHQDAHLDIPAKWTQIESVGATTTLIVEKLCQLQQEGSHQDAKSKPFLTPAQATVMALGIHVDTGSLTFDHATPRDARALAWLMEEGASISTISEYVDPGLSPQLQDLLTLALNNIQTETLSGYSIAWVLLNTENFVPGLSSLVSRLIDLIETDALLFGHSFGDTEETKLTIIGRSRIPQTNLNDLFKPLGGGGHATAASLMCRDRHPQETLTQLVEQLKAQIPHPPSARELMSSPVQTIRPETTVGEAHRILLRYGHSGLSVVDTGDRLVGIISRRDIDIALHHGFSHAPVKGYMTPQLKTITPDTLLPEIEALMVTYDIGRLPVLENNQLVGIVTRTDVLRELHRIGQAKNQSETSLSPLISCPIKMREHLTPQLQQLLEVAAKLAQSRGWQLYLVGGAVRDLLLADSDDILTLTDIDLVVDGHHLSADRDAGVELAKALQKLYPVSRLDIHGEFKTAALLWHKDPIFHSLWIDIATARTEFYPYPAANPEVEASSIRQDLYRRDFTINAFAVRLSEPRFGEILDFFGGLLDLQEKQIRVLHPNSFIEDPTRIYRAVRFAVRLGFHLESQTKEYIRHAIDSGVYYRVQGKNTRAPALETRLRSELKYILQASYWKEALHLLGELNALRCLHPSLELDQPLWRQIRLVDRVLVQRKREEGRGKREEGRGKKEEGRGKKEEGRGKKEESILRETIVTYSQLKSAHFPDWLMRLEVIIAYLEPEHREKVAMTLQLSDDSITRLAGLESAKVKLSELLPGVQKPSELVLLLRQYDLPLLILIALQGSRSCRRAIWDYLTHWALVTPPLNGNDLKAFGYKPGPQFKQMLDSLLVATLDGNVRDRASAEAFIHLHYPLSPQQL
jgi:tRNA nucleotidyltransferase (CCA-adding enzyme)